MKVGVLVSFHNHKAIVRRVAESALSQDFDDYEVIFVDDASMDCSFAELEKVVREFKGFRGKNIKCLLNEKNLGIVGTFNRLMEESSGELCVVHCGDDVAHPNRVAEIVRCWDEAAREHPDLVAALTKCRMVEADLKPFDGSSAAKIWKETDPDLRGGIRAKDIAAEINGIRGLYHLRCGRRGMGVRMMAKMFCSVRGVGLTVRWLLQEMFPGRFSATHRQTI